MKAQKPASNSIYFNRTHNIVLTFTIGLYFITNFYIFNLPSLLIRLFVYPIYLLIFSYLLTLFIRVHVHRKAMPVIAYNTWLLLLLLSILCIVRDVSLDVDLEILRQSYFSSTAAIVWIMPVSLLFGLNLDCWLTWLAKLPQIILIGLLCLCLLQFGNIHIVSFQASGLYNSCDLLFLAPLLGIVAIYRSDTISIVLAITGTISLLLFMLITGERYALAYTGVISCFYLFFFTLEKQRGSIRFISLFILIAVLSTLFLTIANTSLLSRYQHYYYTENQMMADTRSTLGVQMRNQLTSYEWLLGKGMNGKYTFVTPGGESRIRSNIEMGYMQILLKGGATMLIALFFLSATAAYLGFFRSKNKITKYLASMIVARLILMLTAMIPRAGVEYFMYWIIVGGCLSIQLRNLSDHKLKSELLKRSKLIRLKW